MNDIDRRNAAALASCQRARDNSLPPEYADSDETGLYCPECGEGIRVDYTPEYNKNQPWERACDACGWFDWRG